MDKLNEEAFENFCTANKIRIGSTIAAKFKECWAESAKFNQLTTVELADNLSVGVMLGYIQEYGAQLRVRGVGPEVKQAWDRIRFALSQFCKGE